MTYFLSTLRWLALFFGWLLIIALAIKITNEASGYPVWIAWIGVLLLAVLHVRNVKTRYDKRRDEYLLTQHLRTRNMKHPYPNRYPTFGVAVLGGFLFIVYAIIVFGFMNSMLPRGGGFPTIVVVFLTALARIMHRKGLCVSGCWKTSDISRCAVPFLIARI